jgi:hypothetical protein
MPLPPQNGTLPPPNSTLPPQNTTLPPKTRFMQTITIPGVSTTSVNTALTQAGTLAGQISPNITSSLNQVAGSLGNMTLGQIPNINMTMSGMPLPTSGTLQPPQQPGMTTTQQQPMTTQQGGMTTQQQPMTTQQGGMTTQQGGMTTQQQPPQGQGSMSGCLPPMPDNMLKDLATMLTQTDFLGVLSDLTCTTTLPVECDISTAPATYGADWLVNCGQWVVVNIYDGGEAVDTANLVDLCNIVTTSNSLTTTTSARMLASGASVATMPTSSDVTLQDPKIVVNTAVVASTTADVAVANSTATTSVGYSEAALNALNVTATTQLKSTGSGFRAAISVMIIALLSSVYLF